MFQQEIPCVHTLESDIESLFNELLIKFVNAIVIKEAKSTFYVKYDEMENQKDNKELSISFETKNLIKTVSNEEQEEFFSKVRNYFIKGCDYIVSKFPWILEILNHVQVVDISRRDQLDFSSIQYLVCMFQCLLARRENGTLPEAVDAVESEFLNFQIASLPDNVLNSKVLLNNDICY